MKHILAMLAGLGAAVLVAPAVAQDAPQTPTAPQTEAPLACLNSGQTYMPGQIACIPGCHGAERLARCDVVRNTTTWTTVANDCPTANRTPVSETMLAMFGQPEAGR